MWAHFGFKRRTLDTCSSSDDQNLRKRGTSELEKKLNHWIAKPREFECRISTAPTGEFLVLSTSRVPMPGTREFPFSAFHMHLWPQQLRVISSVPRLKRR